MLIDVHSAGPRRLEPRMDTLLKAHISLAAPSLLGCVVHRLNGGVKPVPVAPFRQDWQGVPVAGALSGAE